MDALYAKAKAMGFDLWGESSFAAPTGSAKEPRTDANVEAVRARLLQRAKLGLSKYGVTTERRDMRRVDWLRHAQEEALDLAVYLEAEIQLEIEAANSPSESSSATAKAGAAHARRDGKAVGA